MGVTLYSHTNWNILSTGMFLKIEDCEAGLSYIVINRAIHIANSR